MLDTKVRTKLNDQPFYLPGRPSALHAVLTSTRFAPKMPQKTEILFWPKIFRLALKIFRAAWYYIVYNIYFALCAKDRISFTVSKTLILNRDLGVPERPSCLNPFKMDIFVGVHTFLYLIRNTRSILFLISQNCKCF